MKTQMRTFQGQFFSRGSHVCLYRGDPATSTRTKPHQITLAGKLFLSLLLACLSLRVVDAQQAPVSGPAKIEVELVTLRDGGLYPSKIKRTAGKVLLIVKNRSHSNQMQLGVTRSDGSVIAAVEAITALSQDYFLDLPAGEYTLKESGHPGWTPLTIVTH